MTILVPVQGLAPQFPTFTFCMSLQQLFQSTIGNEFAFFYSIEGQLKGGLHCEHCTYAWAKPGTKAKQEIPLFTLVLWPRDKFPDHHDKLLLSQLSKRLAPISHNAISRI